MSAHDLSQPVRSFRALPATTVFASRAPKRDPRILIVDDDSPAAIDLCIRLPRLGYDVVGHASSGSEALSLAARRPPEVVLIHIAIAGESDGVETARRLFEQFDAGIIYLTEHGDDSMLARASGAQPYTFLSWPLGENDLRRTVEAALHKRRLAHDLCTAHGRSTTAWYHPPPAGHGPISHPVPSESVQLAQVNERLGAMTLQLQHALHAKDAFVAGMSHELRTPLASILGYTDVLLMGLPGKLNDAQERHLKVVQRSSEHLLSLINDLLDLAKLNAGPLDLHLGAVNCKQVFEEGVASVASLAAAKDLVLDAHAPGPELTVLADRRALQQILLNLMGNAIKFTEQGVVRVACRSAMEDGRSCVLWEVRDTGDGLTPDEANDLFIPFKRFNSGTGYAQSGTGLGLHLSQKLAQQMHGSIRVESIRNVGSLFTLVLPAFPADDGYT